MELQHLQWDIICFSQTRAANCDEILQGGHGLICSLKDFRFAGVAILSHRSWADSVQHIHHVSDRVLAVDLQLQVGLKIRVIAV